MIAAMEAGLADGPDSRRIGLTRAAMASLPEVASVEAKDLLERRGPCIGHALLEEL